LFYYKSLHEAPDFADAHFNLSLALERLGDLKATRRHWRIYLDLEPASQSAGYPRKRLKEMEAEDRKK